LFTSSHGAPCYDLAADEALIVEAKAPSEQRRSGRHWS
jgi:hypothetical protein